MFISYQSGVLMQNVPMPMPKPGPSPNLSSVKAAPDAANCAHQCVQEHCADQQFVEMLHSYRDSGGLVRSQEVLALFKRRKGPNATRLSSWIGERDLICFEWHSQAWIPWFQFNETEMTLRPELSQVFAELAPHYRPLELASWFAEPNPWLEDRLPVDAFESDFPAVLNAARADRFVVNG
jgi:hypothetical protein